MSNSYISHILIYVQNTQILGTQQRVYLILIFEIKILPGLIPFASLWHAGCILDKSVIMNTNYRYPTTMYKVFLPKCTYSVSGRKEPHHEKTNVFAYAKTKTQISFAVTAKLISAFVFAT